MALLGLFLFGFVLLVERPPCPALFCCLTFAVFERKFGVLCGFELHCKNWEHIAKSYVYTYAKAFIWDSVVLCVILCWVVVGLCATLVLLAFFGAPVCTCVLTHWIFAIFLIENDILIMLQLKYDKSDTPGRCSLTQKGIILSWCVLVGCCAILWLLVCTTHYLVSMCATILSHLPWWWLWGFFYGLLDNFLLMSTNIDAKLRCVIKLVAVISHCETWHVF